MTDSIVISVMAIKDLCQTKGHEHRLLPPVNLSLRPHQQVSKVLIKKDDASTFSVAKQHVRCLAFLTRVSGSGLSLKLRTTSLPYDMRSLP